MRIRSAGIALLVLGLAPSAGAQTRLKACEELSDLAIPASEIGLPTSGVTVTVTRHPADAPPRQDADGGSAQDVPAHCNVQDQIRPVDPAATPVTLNVNLPSHGPIRRPSCPTERGHVREPG